MKLFVAVTFLLVGPLLATSAMSESMMMSKMEKSKVEAKAMEGAFLRSESTHKASMAAMEKSMTVETAANVMDKSKKSTKELSQVTSMVRQGKTKLRASPKGYSGIEGARKMLNDMIYDTFLEYDRLISACQSYYYWQCGNMEWCRGQISASNFIAANARNFILDAQGIINRCEEDIPTKSNERNKTKVRTEEQLDTMEQREKVVMADLDVLTTILEMTDCKASGFMQVRRCTDCRTKEVFLEFGDAELQKHIAKLKSKKTLKAMHQTFEDLFAGVQSLQNLEFIQTGAKQMPVNKTNFSNPPVPRTEVPQDPCNGETVPAMATKEGASCEFSNSPKCYKLQERFLLIQSGVKDEYEELLDNIANLKEWLDESLNQLQDQIDEDKRSLYTAQADLAAAMQKEATAGENARVTESYHDRLDKDLKYWMGYCSQDYIRLEGEVCALKKIRGELYKIKGGGHNAFFQDCEVSKWEPHTCYRYNRGGLSEAKCGGGWQYLTRSVLTHAEGGAKCLPFWWYRFCNAGPCPVDCRLGQWTGWSKCSAECGGGVQERLRDVKQAAAHGGKSCKPTTQGRGCNIQACEEDCELSSWSPWSKCSKMCDGGTQKRTRYPTHGPEGEGKCPSKWALERLEYKKCNEFSCELPDPNKALPCESEMDVVLLIDGSGSLGQAGWDAEIKAAKLLVDAFADGAVLAGGKAEEAKAQMAVILYSGPRTWSGVDKCTGSNKDNVNIETDCNIKIVTHFNKDMTEVKKEIGKLTWPKGSTLTSLALMTAKSLLILGRANEPSAVVVITDGRPLSYRRTGAASRNLRKLTRLLWLPVTSRAPLSHIKSWATRRWEENTVAVKNFDDLEKPDSMSKVISDICPEPYGYAQWH